MTLNIAKKFKNKKTLGRLKNRDKDAFIKVYDENVKEIYRFVYFKIGHQEEAHDLTSTIFLKAWNHIQNKTLEDAKTLRALLYKIARTSIIDYYRSRGAKIKATISLDKEDFNLDFPDEETLNPAQKIDFKNDFKLIKSKLPLLKDEYREIIIMRFINDLSMEEIVDITGKSKGALRVLIHRAITALRELVEKELEL